jgi:hypothetical protein
MEFIEKYFSKYPQEKIIKWFKQICLAEAVSWFFSVHSNDFDTH